MSRLILTSAVFAIFLFAKSGINHAYDYFAMGDESALCEGFSPETHSRRVQHQANQQRSMLAEYQNALAYELAAEQKSLEMVKLARRARIEKEARLRYEMIAKRKAEMEAKSSKKVP